MVNVIRKENRDLYLELCDICLRSLSFILDATSFSFSVAMCSKSVLRSMYIREQGRNTNLGLLDVGSCFETPAVIVAIIIELKFSLVWD